MNEENIKLDKNIQNKQKLIAGIISAIIIVLLIIGIYFFFIKSLKPDNNSTEIKYLSLTDTKVVDLFKMIDVFSDKYNWDNEKTYENYIKEFFSLDKKSPEDLSDELKLFMGLRYKFDYNELEYSKNGTSETVEISSVDIKNGAKTIFGNNLEYNVIDFDTGNCHFGKLVQKYDSLFYIATKETSNCDNTDSEFMVELITALEDNDKISMEIQAGFVKIEEGTPVLYTTPEMTGRVSNNISEFEKNGSYLSALTFYKNNLNLYSVVFEYTGTEYRLSSVERTK